MHYHAAAPEAADAAACPIAAIAHNTRGHPESIWAAPGQYSVRLTANGKTYTQPLTLRMDPRVKTPALGLQQQFTLSKALYDDVKAAQNAVQQIRAAQSLPNAAAFSQRLTELAGAAGFGGRGGGGRGGSAGGSGHAEQRLGRAQRADDNAAGVGHDTPGAVDRRRGRSPRGARQAAGAVDRAESGDREAVATGARRSRRSGSACRRP